MTLDELNHLPAPDAWVALERCCGASAWVEHMCSRRPYRSRAELLAESERAAATLEPDDWREAFGHHPRIGDLSTLRERYASTAAWASDEQRGATAAPEAVLVALAGANQKYEDRFGHIFIVCATGNSAEQMLALLESRMHNDSGSELKIAAEEQMKITRLRLEKLLGDTP